LQKKVLFFTEPRPVLGPTQPPTISASAVSLGIKRQGREADHSPPSIAEVKNGTHPHVFMAWCLMKHGDNFVFIGHYIGISPEKGNLKYENNK
jgi:hypothetical protein